MDIRPWKVYEEEIKASLTEPQTSKTRLVTAILLFRIFYLVAMMLSCQIIPDHNPGDDVLRFDMRFRDDNHGASNCFCLSGHSCESFNAASDVSQSDCAISKAAHHHNASSWTWNFVLQPSTKWDAARFLHLALDPHMRDPSISNESYARSEQAHAFLPMFPWILRTTAQLLYRTLPAALLPPTYEALLVWSGVLLHTFLCLPVSVLALYTLTLQVTQGNDYKYNQNDVERHHRLAVATCLLFGIWNPASVFFATNYSESFFAMTTLLGHVCMQCRARNRNGMASFAYWCMGIACWMMGSYTRSNGTLHCLWLLQDGIARVCHGYFQLRQSKERVTLPLVLRRILPTILSSLAGAILVALPVRYHDWQGYQRHCVNAHIASPSWCLEENPTMLWGSFSLYRYVQNKHWNVGLFRYYEWKQIPNFLLAAPILMLSVGGVVSWIQGSLVTDFGKGKVPSSLRAIVWEWPLQALNDSVGTGETRKTSFLDEKLVRNPLLLGHYAILAILALIGLVIAHVQISTRMICSTSPGVLWFMTYCMLHPKYGKVVWYYAILYMLLGVILHVNFLPWT